MIRNPRLLRTAGTAVVVLLLAQLLMVAPATAQQTSRNLATFDAAWGIINETHWDPDFNGVDWEAVRDELRPLAAEAETDGELREVINDMIARLGQSHFAIWPQGAIEEAEDRPRPRGGIGQPGFQLLLVDGQFLVSQVDPDGPAAVAGVQPGWVVAEIEGEVVEAPGITDDDGNESMYLLARAQRGMQQRLMGPTGDTVDVMFLDADDAPRQLQVDLVAPEGQITSFGNMPAVFARLDDRIVAPDVGLDVGVIGFNIWLPLLARPFMVALDTMREADGIILDLRGNPGGIGGMVMGIGGHFVDEVVSLGTMKTRQSDLDFVTNPRRIDAGGNAVEPFSGPLAILMDSTSASTSEVFAGGLQAIGRARVFGQTSMGAVLPSLMEELPNGDILQHAVADFIVTANDVRLEGRGVIPDEEVVVTRAALLAGRDPIFEAAVEWIARQQ